MTWVADSTLIYKISTDESNNDKSFFIRIRYSLDYPYQNLYYSYSLIDSLDTIIHNPLNEILLFNQKSGKPIGSGISSLFTIEENIIQKIKNNNKQDIKNGFTSYGPHRDEILFLWNKKGIRKHGSQGEHKLFLALLKITELLFLSKKTKKNPIFLIDDLFASLDKEKSKKLLAFAGKLQSERKKRQQTIITTTDFVDLEKNGFFLGFKQVKKHHIYKNGNT